MAELIIIVAVADNEIIGKENDIPWRIGKDLAHFKKATIGHPCIMGDKTFESLPEVSRPLTDRENVVLTLDKSYKQKGTTIFHDFYKALEYLKNEDKVFIIGGATIYKLGLKVADKLMLTRVHKSYRGDIKFPEVKWGQWELISTRNVTDLDKKSGDKVNLSFETYSRIKTTELSKTDLVIDSLINSEKERQNSQANLIPSENICSDAVREASGSVLMNKYAEGYSGKRYYQGNKYIDKIEQIAINRAKELFGAEHVNVQPNSGSAANIAVYNALLKPGDKIMAMNLSHGGHLTHGSPVNFSGKTYQIIPYGVSKNGKVSMKKVQEIAQKYRPQLIISGYTAYPGSIDFKKFAQIANDVGAISMADISHIAGLIAGRYHNSPFPFTDVVTTTTHKSLRGPRSAIIMCKEAFAKSIDKSIFPGLQGGPHEHTIAAKAVAFGEAMSSEFQKYSKQIVLNAKALAKSLIENKISLVMNGTENHLILIDLTKILKKEGMGRQAAEALERANIITNANTIPFDPSTPFKPSGIRLGTPMITTQGMRQKDMRLLGKYISEVLFNLEDEKVIEKVGVKVTRLCARTKKI